MSSVPSAPATDSVDSDALLVLRTRAGDETAYAELWRRHASAGRAVARGFSTLDDEDLVAESFTRIYEAIRNGGGPTGAFRPYLFTTIRNTAASWGRAPQTTTIDTLDTIEDPDRGEEAQHEALDRSLVADAFRSLPTRWQEVLWYGEVEELTPRQIAPLIGMSANSTSALTYRAREGLRQAWIQAHLRSAVAADCRWALEHLGAHTRKRLGPRDARRLDVHLDDCASCRDAAAEAKHVGARLALVLLPLTAGLAGAASYAGWLRDGAPAAGVAAGALGVPATEGSAAAGSIPPPIMEPGTSSAGTSAAATSAAGTTASTGAATAGIGAGAGAVAGLAGGALLVAAAVAAAVVLPSLPGPAPAADLATPAAVAEAEPDSPLPTVGASPEPVTELAPAPDRATDLQPIPREVGPPASPPPPAGAPEPAPSVDAPPSPSAAPNPAPHPAPPEPEPNPEPAPHPAPEPEPGPEPEPEPAAPPAPVVHVADTAGGLADPILSGLAGPRSAVTVTDERGGSWTADADGTGSWTVAVHGLPPGASVLRLTQTEPGGRISEPAEQLVELAAPEVRVTVLSLDLRGVPNSIVELMIDGTPWMHVPLDADGAASRLFPGWLNRIEARYSVPVDGGARTGPAVRAIR
ncbi:sigma-70 family RNA polymerase sigma factor [Agromyces aerolatus]|uniref:sigma-70 family RNA polymerase sigma factor n=1 Tax=Agromyces sp. LY-1074 TaxID=3074080 RepID=UPI00285629A1|nr:MULTISPECIES: sigma-70 family RNA polymerase sigma factor [unclassified Agromyces]MDR5698276.1 sigma-70 family RNA polymerase sigma factor [Agromyces sp. LY-1074]MDR5704570.1 sigma-70 family RNA polymerase sigma factor [Agromyces sp. LY-1358]